MDVVKFRWLVCFVLAGCGPGIERADALCEDVQCNAPPSPECISGQLRTYADSGTCELTSGVCSYASTSEACEHGCLDATRCRGIGDILWFEPDYRVAWALTADEKIIATTSISTVRSLDLNGTPQLDYAGSFSSPSSFTWVAIDSSGGLWVHSTSVRSLVNSLSRIDVSGAVVYQKPVGSVTSGLSLNRKDSAVIRASGLLRTNVDGTFSTIAFPYGFGPTVFAPGDTLVACGGDGAAYLCAAFDDAGASLWQQTVAGTVAAAAVDADARFIVLHGHTVSALKLADGVVDTSVDVVAAGVGVLYDVVIEQSGDLIVTYRIEEDVAPFVHYYVARLARGTLEVQQVVELPAQPWEIAAARDGSLYVLYTDGLASLARDFATLWSLSLPPGGQGAHGLLVTSNSLAVFDAGALGVTAVLVQAPLATSSWPVAAADNQRTYSSH